MLPGGTTNPDTLRLDAGTAAFVKASVEAGGVSGHGLASWPSPRTDLRDAVASRVDETVVADGRW